MSKIEEIAESALLKLTARAAWPVVAVAMSAIGTLAWWQWEKVNDLAVRVPLVEQSLSAVQQTILERGRDRDIQIGEVKSKVDGLQDKIDTLGRETAQRTVQIVDIIGRLGSIETKLDRLFVPRHADLGVPGARTTLLEVLHSPPMLFQQK